MEFPGISPGAAVANARPAAPSPPPLPPLPLGHPAAVTVQPLLPPMSPPPKVTLLTSSLPWEWSPLSKSSTRKKRLSLLHVKSTSSSMRPCAITTGAPGAFAEGSAGGTEEGDAEGKGSALSRERATASGETSLKRCSLRDNPSLGSCVVSRTSAFILPTKPRKTRMQGALTRLYTDSASSSLGTRQPSMEASVSPSFTPAK
mmetsp:Transcript_46884/g.118793  ORF Transcript_46884/g.118793 Transcript_46884/m.118793 type:complete len:202 (-) Transcript_46884:297-902(-)